MNCQWVLCPIACKLIKIKRYLSLPSPIWHYPRAFSDGYQLIRRDLLHIAHADRSASKYLQRLLLNAPKPKWSRGSLQE